MVRLVFAEPPPKVIYFHEWFHTIPRAVQDMLLKHFVEGMRWADEQSGPMHFRMSEVSMRDAKKVCQENGLEIGSYI